LGYIEKYLTLGILSVEKWRTNPNDGWRLGQAERLSGTWSNLPVVGRGQRAEGSLGHRRLRFSTLSPTV